MAMRAVCVTHPRILLVLYHLERDTLRELLLKNSRHLDRFMQIVEEGHQGPDHPMHPAIPETAYLKAFFVRVLPN
jgi:23S rRNA (cytosine1962-C5)-methyltransferase